MSAEPCVVCGEDTSLGHPEYLGRRQATGPDGAARYLCAECLARSDPARRHELTDEERQRMLDHASMFLVGYDLRAIY